MGVYMGAAIKARQEVPVDATWDLSDLFSNFNHWQTAFNALPTVAEVTQQLETSYKGQLSDSPEKIVRVLEFRDGLSRKLVNLYVYASLRSSEDVGASEASTCLGKISNQYAALMAPFAFVDPELLQVAALDQWKDREPLSKYGYEMSELLRGKKHVLSEKEENLLARLSPCLGRNAEIFSKWNNVDLQFEDVLDGAGHSHTLSHSRYGSYLESSDRVLRENTFRTFYRTFSKWRHTIAANFYSRLLTGSTLAKVRSYDGFLHSQLFQDDIPLSLYDNLIASVRAHLPKLSRSLQLRKSVLKIDAVHHYDRYVSLASGKGRRFSWNEAVEIVLASVAPLGEEYVAIARKGLTQDRWVDYAENTGKRSGAFSSGSYDSRPYILMTWTGTLADVYTLAHELGHSMHSYLSNQAQPYHIARYTIFVAEVASTLNESLLTEHLLNAQGDRGLREEVCSYWLKGFEATVIRQVLFATFERDTAARVDAGEPLTADAFDEVYESLNKEFYGVHSAIDPEVKNEWMRIPHFYSTFYVYKYATSYCASLSLLESLIKDSASGRKQVMTLLRTGGSISPLDTMRAAGIDFLSGQVFEDAFSVYDQNIARAESLFLKS
jgi:oligoendopeptidase F